MSTLFQEYSISLVRVVVVMKLFDVKRREEEKTFSLSVCRRQKTPLFFLKGEKTAASRNTIFRYDAVTKSSERRMGRRDCGRFGEECC
jgi:hypothetical protein